MTVQTRSRRTVLVGAVASAAAFLLTRSKSVAAEPVTHKVRITSFEFLPAELAVSVGDKVEWINEDLAPHTATADAFGWDTGEIVKDGSAVIEITGDMELTYFCTYHPHMKGRLIIR